MKILIVIDDYLTKATVCAFQLSDLHMNIET